jgi:uncharacterized protein (DUF488 family)
VPEGSRAPKRRRTRTLYSIGYEGRSQADFIDLLIAHRVQVLADVRLTPISRKPGFSKKSLATALGERGIVYEHHPTLGNPKENRPLFAGVQIEEGRRRFLAHLNNGSRTAFDSLLQRANKERIAVVCFERDDRRCHRSCITDQAIGEEPALRIEVIA